MSQAEGEAASTFTEADKAAAYEQAKATYTHYDDDLEFDDLDQTRFSEVDESDGCAPGAWVSCWVWVSRDEYRPEESEEEEPCEAKI